MYTTSIESRIDLTPDGNTAALFVGRVSSLGRPFLSFGLASIAKHHGSVLTALSTADARAVAQAFSKVVVAAEDMSPVDASVFAQLADASFDFSALIPTEKNPTPGYELAITVTAETGYASMTAAIDATQIRDIVLTLMQMSNDLDAAVAEEDATIAAGPPAEPESIEQMVAGAVAETVVTPEMPEHLH